MCHDVPVTAPRRRADAAENRDRILAAARAELAGNADVRLNAIAQRAGVGQGTLYRHFPTREDLLAEVYRADVDELVAAATALLARFEPIDALRRWFDRVADYARVKRVCFAALEAATRQNLADHSHGPIGDYDPAARRGQGRQGHSARCRRPRCHPAHRLSVTRLDPEEFDTRARHLLRIVLDGIRLRESPPSARD